MARYTGPVYKKSRRLGFSILETGEELAKKPTAPGQHGTSRKKLSEYGVQLQEKQKVRFMYGLNEKQFRKTFVQAGKMKGIHGINLLILLESRLDNLVYRLGMANTRKAARQLVNHGHILVNGKRVDIPSYQVKPGNIISVSEKSQEHPVINSSLENTLNRPSYVSFDSKKKEGTYVRYPEREELNVDINESLIVEFYNR
ncbi:MAG: 30S ribosomal protein S4 [Bacilli bacterium]|nr:30S ribosomal protein S4 [Bacilli bacterium]